MTKFLHQGVVRPLLDGDAVAFRESVDVARPTETRLNSCGPVRVPR